MSLFVKSGSCALSALQQFLINGRVVRLDLAQLGVDLALELVHLGAHLRDVVVQQRCQLLGLHVLLLLFLIPLHGLDRVLERRHRLHGLLLDRLDDLLASARTLTLPVLPLRVVVVPAQTVHT